MSEKVVGYLLLGVGLLVIILSAFNVYQVFTKQVTPIPLFELSPVALDLGQLIPGAPSQNAKAELFPASDLNFISNLTAHYLLMSFFIGVGAKVSALGISLLRPIEVKVEKTRVGEALISATKQQ